MSYANGTTHYNLPQTVGTDKRDWADTNEAFAAIDAATYTALETAASGASEIAAIAATVANLGNAQVTLQHDVDGLTVTVGTQGTSIGNLGNKIDEVEDDCLDMVCAIDEGTAQIATVPVNEGDYFRYNNVLYMADDDIAVGDTIVPNTNCHATNVATELQNISPSGEVVDATARAEIGTMANLQTTDKSSLVAAINEVLSQIGGAKMKCVLAGSFRNTQVTTHIDLSSFNFADASDYVVIANGTWFSASSTTFDINVLNKTATGFDLGLDVDESSAPTFACASYQVLA